MLRFLADENLNNNIIRGLALRDRSIDLVRAVEAGIGNTPDPEVLAFAAAQGRIVLSHDVATLAGFAYERVSQGLAMPGVVEVPEWLGVGPAIEDLLLIAGAGVEGEFEGCVIYLPLR